MKNNEKDGKDVKETIEEDVHETKTDTAKGKKKELGKEEFEKKQDNLNVVLITNAYHFCKAKTISNGAYHFCPYA